MAGGPVSSNRTRIVDIPLIVIVLLLCGAGLVNLNSAAHVDGMAHHLTQSVWMIFGGVIATGLALQDTRLFERTAYVFFGFVCILLVLVPLVGTDNNTTAQRWLDLGFFDLQPSELMKVAVILATARYFHQNERPEGHGPLDLLRPLGMVAIPFVLILIQPDLGTALTILLIFGTMVIFERIKRSTFVIAGISGVIAVPLMWFFVMKDYQKMRVLSFLNPDENLQGDAWQVSQSKIAIGSGRLFGKGYLQGTQVQNGFVPEHENDFIFAHHGEQFGFIGSAALILLYFILILWCLRVARLGRDRFSVLTAVGIAAFFFWHVLINLGMVSGLLPVVGLWLPLASYGGSAMLTVMILIGVLLSISLRRHVF